MKERAYFNWSSGKDSAMALYKAVESNLFDITTLFTVVNTESKKISMHEISLDLLQQQAECIGLPLTIFNNNINNSSSEYKDNMKTMMDSFKAQNISTAIFGDIYLEELRNSREQNCLQSEINAVFPLWNIPTKDLLREFVDLGFKSIITCVNNSILDEIFVGRIIDHNFINELPPEVDPCGENGEYHSFVFDGPIFNKPVDFKVVYKFYMDYPTQDCNDMSQSFNRFWYATLK